MDKVLIAVVGVLVGALATGGLQVAMRFWELRLAARVAARIVQGDAYVAGAAFELLDEREVWFRLDFDPALRTWSEHRRDLAAGLSSPDWARVGAFYSNLERSAAMAREPGEAATDGDLKVAREMVKFAAEASGVVIELVPKGFKWRWLPKGLRKHLKRQREIDETVAQLERETGGDREGGS